jgi:Gametolysin peptidase M11
LTPPILGAQRVLVVLVTWGPQPFTRDEVQHVVFETDAFYRESSYGKAWLTGTVTPWLNAFDGSPGCSVPLIRTAGAAAARTAGYDPAAYERIIYVQPSVDCPWSGVTQANTIFLDGMLSRKLVAHELGHAFGLPHANSTACRRAGCPAEEYGDPYDTMGGGSGDFSAYAKFSLGWLTRIARPAASGVYQLDRGSLVGASGVPGDDGSRPVLDRVPGRAGSHRPRRQSRWCRADRPREPEP